MNHIQNAGLIFMIFLLHPRTVFSQYDLTIEIGPLKNNTGQVKLAFLDENENVIQEAVADIKEKKCIIVLEDLEQGTYAFKYFHDENKNEKLDTKFIFIPKEGYGFSNDAKGKYGPPPFKDSIFQLKADSTIICKPIY